ncbi:MAG: hypothetical protein JNK21_07035, partial [Rhodospirillaceae bacterium]|nr:hypothetical protein [Rhodospirillaceae bacterium]
MAAGITAGLSALGAGVALAAPEEARLPVLAAAALSGVVSAGFSFFGGRSSAADVAVATLSGVIERISAPRVLTDRQGRVLAANGAAKDWLLGEE